MDHISINMEKTWQLLKSTIQEAGYSVKYIQEYLQSTDGIKAKYFHHWIISIH